MGRRSFCCALAISGRPAHTSDMPDMLDLISQPAKQLRDFELIGRGIHNTANSGQWAGHGLAVAQGDAAFGRDAEFAGRLVIAQGHWSAFPVLRASLALS